MDDLATLEASLRNDLALMRGRLSGLEFAAQKPNGMTPYPADILAASNKVLNCALDISKTVAHIERVVSEQGNKVLRER
jgi:hypothetical protein